MPHPKHPRCPYCGKALYKKRTKDEPMTDSGDWRWCRNEDCDFFLVDQTTGKKYGKRNKKKPIKNDYKESAVVKKIREEVVKKLNGEAVLHYVLTLAVVSQEIGRDELASFLIEEYGLDEVFNIRR